MQPPRKAALCWRSAAILRKAAARDPINGADSQFTRCAGTRIGFIQHPHRLARGVRNGLWQK